MPACRGRRSQCPLSRRKIVPGTVALVRLQTVIREAVHLVGDGGVVPCVSRQATVVGSQVDGGVTDHDALEVDAVVPVLQDLLHQLRNVMTGVSSFQISVYFQYRWESSPHTHAS
jgi:hypothetical protein